MIDEEIQASDEEMEQFNVLQNEKCVSVKTEKLNDLKNRISFALKDAALVQGFEIICNRIAELEKGNEELVDKKTSLEKRIFELEKENEDLKKNALFWHDLRKDPNDLPEERGDYWIKYDDASEERGSFYDVHYFEPEKPFYKKHWSEIGVMAWCRLPKFEE